MDTGLVSHAERIEAVEPVHDGGVLAGTATGECARIERVSSEPLTRSGSERLAQFESDR